MIRVLLAEDENLIRPPTAEILRDEGFKATEVRNGDEAAELLDGIDVSKHLRQRPSAIPVPIVSDYAAHPTGRLGKLQPPAVLIGKPYDMQEIVAALNRTMVKL